MLILVFVPEVHLPVHIHLSKKLCCRITFRSVLVQIATNPVQVLKRFGSSSVLDLGESKAALAAAAELEAALVEHVYSSPQTALGHLQAAGDALGMHTIVEGQRAELQCSDFVCFVMQGKRGDWGGMWGSFSKLQLSLSGSLHMGI